MSAEKKKKKKKKKNALVFGHDNKSFWTTQDQFWQWVRDSVIIKTGDGPLQGKFLRQNEEYNVVISNTVLNIKYPNHLREALLSRRKALQ
jgi:hypothetical protein